MQKYLLVSISFLLLLVACDSNTSTVTADTTKTQETTTKLSSVTPKGTLDKTDKMAQIAYAMGANSGIFLARNLPEFEKWGMEVDPEFIKMGFLESLEDKSQMDDQEVQTVLMAFQEQIKTKLAEIAQKQAKVTAEANKIFLDANAAKEGITTTESGIQYRVIEAGTGANPVATDKVKVHYRGTLVDGTEFDSSFSRNEPASFALNSVISGWTEGLQLIKEGGKIELVLPPELAYGERATPTIPANSVLIFEVQLLEIIKAEEKKE
ncbi:MAG: FKBP-type peptidyl-prolyl cis-trans isomerase [Gammaproteobacteria bacterium]|nr:FKBP-type peptidyl-prolyl cis-trans isomerase [Gammaproteobacteria bacterium]